jgi:hypothetical protein
VKGKCSGWERSQNRFEKVRWNVRAFPAIKLQKVRVV